MVIGSPVLTASRNSSPNRSMVITRRSFQTSSMMSPPAAMLSMCGPRAKGGTYGLGSTDDGATQIFLVELLVGWIRAGSAVGPAGKHVLQIGSGQVKCLFFRHQCLSFEITGKYGSTFKCFLSHVFSPVELVLCTLRYFSLHDYFHEDIVGEVPDGRVVAGLG